MPSTSCRCCWCRWRWRRCSWRPAPPAGGVAALLALGLAEAVLLWMTSRLQRFQGDLRPASYAGREDRRRVTRRAATTPARRLHRTRGHRHLQQCRHAGVEGPPRFFGLYRDGNRIAALPVAARRRSDTNTLARALDALPYTLILHRPRPAGRASGGFRIAEVAPRAPRISMRWNRNLCCSAPSRPRPSARSPPAPAMPAGCSRLRGRRRSKRHRTFDIIDLSADFLDAAEINAHRVRREAIVPICAPCTRRDAVDPGLHSRLPGLCAADAGHGAGGAAVGGDRRPAAHVLVYRSAWNVRILIAPDGWSAARIDAAKKFADDRSFDMAWYPGDGCRRSPEPTFTTIFRPSPSTRARSNPAVRMTPSPTRPGGVVRRGLRPRREQFNLSPITLDRPFVYAVLRLDRLGTILKRLEILPQAEVGRAGQPRRAGAGGGDRAARPAGAAAAPGASARPGQGCFAR